jgi:putative oxidoreductase
MKKVARPLLSALLAAVFIYAGAVKAFDTSHFYQDILAYHLVSEESAWLLAHFLPWFEVIAGVSLFVKSIQFYAGLVIASLLLVFMTAILSAWIRHLNIECGCFGSSASESSYAWILLRDSLLLFSTMYLLGFTLRQDAKSQSLQAD